MSAHILAYTRQLDNEGRAFAFAGVDVHVPAVVAGDVAHDRQAQARAASGPAAGAVDAVEALEDAVAIARRDADAVVGHGQLDVVAVVAGADLHRRAGIGVLDGV